jgi:hypothetical protein
MTWMNLAVKSHEDGWPKTIRMEGIRIYPAEETPKEPYSLVGLVTSYQGTSPLAGPVSDSAILEELALQAKRLNAEAILDLTIVSGTRVTFRLNEEGSLVTDSETLGNLSDQWKSGAGRAVVFQNGRNGIGKVPFRPETSKNPVPVGPVRADRSPKK